MDIDARIEALTQSVELIASLHKDLERQTAEHLARMADAITRLANIAEAHEQRIRDLEDQQQ